MAQNVYSANGEPASHPRHRWDEIEQETGEVRCSQMPQHRGTISVPRMLIKQLVCIASLFYHDLLVARG